LIDESVLVDSSISFAVEPATLAGGEALLGRAARAAHRRAALLDDLPRVGVAVLVALSSAPRLGAAVEHRRIALLPGRGGSLPASEHPRRALLFTEGRVILNIERTHVVLLLVTAKGSEHSFALDLDSARKIGSEIQRVLAEAEVPG
jgi:hypothetical protein